MRTRKKASSVRDTDDVPSAGFIFKSDNEAWVRAGEAVARRRTELNLTHREAAAQMNGSPATWSRLENGVVPNNRVQRQSISKIEKILGWVPGSFEAVLFDGDDPTLLEDEPSQGYILDSVKSLTSRMDSLEGRVETLERKLDTIIEALKAF